MNFALTRASPSPCAAQNARTSDSRTKEGGSVVALAEEMVLGAHIASSPARDDDDGGNGDTSAAKASAAAAAGP